MHDKNNDFDLNNLISKNDLKTFFVYDVEKTSSKILDIFEDEKSTKFSFNKEVWVIFDKTPFFAEQSGQASDVGEMVIDNISNKVIDVQINDKNQILHKIKLNTKASINDDVLLKIDIKKRILTSINHSSAHLLYATLKKVISDEKDLDQKNKKQSSFYNQDYLKLDFISKFKIEKEQLIKTENLINKIISKKVKSEIFITIFKKALKLGAIYFFKKDTPDDASVRVVKFNNYSMEMCCGTHVKNTSEIEIFRFFKFIKDRKNIYKIYAVTTNKKLKKLNDEYFSNLNNLLKTVKEKIDYLNDEEINKQLFHLQKTPRTFIGYKEKFEDLKKLVFQKYKNKKINENLSLVKKYIIPSKDIKIKNNLKFIFHKLSNDLNKRKEIFNVLFRYLQEEETNSLICLFNEIKTNLNSINLFDKTNSNINWIKILKDEFKENIVGSGYKNRFIGIIKNIEIQKIIDFIDKKLFK